MLEVSSRKRSSSWKWVGKKLQGMFRPILVIQKRNRFGLGYKPDIQGRKKFMEEKKKKRIASFFGKVVEDGKMEIPSLSYSFHSAGFINLGLTQKGEKNMTMDVDVNEAFGSLTIDMIEVDEPETRNIGLPPFSRGQILNNWTVVELPVVFKFHE